MQNLIDEILQDLYKLDPDLMKKEKQVKSIIEEMISSKPNVKIDEAFKNQLKNIILNEIGTAKKPANLKGDNKWLSNLWFAVGGLAVGIGGFALFFNMVMVPWFDQKTQDQNYKFSALNGSSPKNDLRLSFDTKLNKLGDRAFGDITTIDNAKTGLLSGEVTTGTVGNSFESQPQKESSPTSPDVQLEQIVKAVDAKIQASDSISNPTEPTPASDMASDKRNTESLDLEATVQSDDEINLLQDTKTTKTSQTNKSSNLSTRSMVADKGGSSVSEDIYVPTTYQYVYSGEKIEISQSMMPVYKKIKVGFEDKDFVNIVKNIDVGKLDMSKFTDLKMTTISLSQDKEFGFDISINFKEGNLYFYKNFEKWPVNCFDMMKLSSSSSYPQNCSGYKINITDIPDDDKLLKIADEFVNQYGIDTKDFGKPVIDNYRKIGYENSIDKENYYLPDTINVVYPRIVDGKEIYEEYGQQKGLKIGVDIKQMKVSSLNSLEKLQFDLSNYEIDQNFDNILKVAEKGGRYGFTNDLYTQGSKVVTLTLLQPELKYIDYYTYKDGKSEEYLVPSYIFPVDKSNLKTQEYAPTTIVVPLTKDFYKYDGSGDVVGLKE